MKQIQTENGKAKQTPKTKASTKKKATEQPKELRKKIEMFDEIKFSDELLKKDPKAKENLEYMILHFGMIMMRYNGYPSSEGECLEDFVANLSKMGILFPITITSVRDLERNFVFTFLTADDVMVKVRCYAFLDNAFRENIVVTMYKESLTIETVVEEFFKTSYLRRITLKLKDLKGKNISNFSVSLHDLFEENDKWIISKKDLELRPKEIIFEREDGCGFLLKSFFADDNKYVTVSDLAKFACKVDWDNIKTAKQFSEICLKNFGTERAVDIVKESKNNISILDPDDYDIFCTREAGKILKGSYRRKNKYAETLDNGLTLCVTYEKNDPQIYLYNEDEWIVKIRCGDQKMEIEFPKSNLTNIGDYNIDFKQIQDVLKENLKDFLVYIKNGEINQRRRLDLLLENFPF